MRPATFKKLGAYEDTLDYFLTLSAEFNKKTTPSTRSENPPDVTSHTAKLPKLDLPTFSGKYEDWESFADLFTSLVHNVPCVDDSTKLHYLKSCLTGPAADLVKDVATTNENYCSTWQALKNRFYNPLITVSKHLNALLNIPHVKRESATEIRAFTDECQRIVRALTNLKMPIEHWDIWLVHILGSRLDSESRKLWESELSAKDRAPHAGTSVESIDSAHLSHFPTFAELSIFLEKRAYALSMISYNSESKSDKRSYQTTNNPLPGSRKLYHASARHQFKSEINKCPLCLKLHSLGKCPDFLAKSPFARRGDVRQLRLCYNCLGRHRFRECPSTSRCNTCREKHHSLIHFGNKATTQGASAPSNHQTREEKIAPSVNMNINTASISDNVNARTTKYSVVLATVQVNVVSDQGAIMRVRALLDQGAEGSFVSKSVVQFLRLPKQRVKVLLTGIGGRTAGSANAKTTFCIQSTVDPAFRVDVEALVLPRLTAQLPSRNLVDINLDEFSDLVLADPQFYIANSVDLILGADVYGNLLRPGLRRFSTSHLVAQDTTLGWVLSGSMKNFTARRVEQNSNASVRTLHSVPRDALQESLEKFWTLEELPLNSPRLSPEDKACDKLFRETHVRAPHGRYVVRLPLKSDLPNVGAETRRMDLGALNCIHGRFIRDPAFAHSYREFMTIYESLRYMSKIPIDKLNNPKIWYLPHHAVRSASKLRVVFDASRRTSAHHCLNDFLMSGPALQHDLSMILLNWRRYKYVFTADIIKMFREIRVAPADQVLQRIVWSSSHCEAPVEYRLSTVTYGTACAPYLAIRTLRQLVQDERSRFPLGAQCLESETYVDDTFAGANDLETAIRKPCEIIELLKSAGIELGKWAANHEELLPSSVQRNEATVSKEIDGDNAVKTLGVQLNPTEDVFRFSAKNLGDVPEPLTKRHVLSNIAWLFDPLGWLSPITITAKIILQDLWINKSSWDAPVPADIGERWLNYHDSLSELHRLSVDRWLGTSSDELCEIHGFADESSRAYAAVVYLRMRENDNSFRINLLEAKTKVAPVKTASIPNLELCGAALVVKLVRRLQALDFIKNLPIVLWSDSEIVLKRLNKHPCHWKTFMANRVSQIQTDLPDAKWLHISTKENPADMTTRGSKPIDLCEFNLWWKGPT